MPKDPMSGAARRGSAFTPPPDARRYPLRRTAWYDEALKVLGVPDAQFVTVKLETRFEAQWLGGATHAELNSAWEYKAPKVTQQCKPLNVRQIRVGKNIRVLFTIVEERAAAYYVDVWHKTGKAAQDTAIERACARAKTIREDIERGRIRS